MRTFVKFMLGVASWMGAWALAVWLLLVFFGTLITLLTGSEDTLLVVKKLLFIVPWHTTIPALETGF